MVSERDQNGVLSRLKTTLEQSFDEIFGNETTAAKEETLVVDLAHLIFDSMHTPSRLYHNEEHVVEVLDQYHYECSLCNENPDPVSLLAILFHDVIYISLDKTLSPRQSTLLYGVVREENDVMKLLPPKSPAVSMVYTVFGVPHVPTTEESSSGSGQPLPCPGVGTNELLSALVAVQVLQAILSRPHLLQLAVAIEATVPFRPTTADGQSPMDRLFERAMKAYSSFSNDNDNDKDSNRSFVTRAVHQAVRVAHSDVGVFGASDSTLFIDSNWRLLPEWFAEIRPIQQQPDDKGPLLTDFKAALANVLQRRPLDPRLIFPSFQGLPTSLEDKQRQTSVNLKFLGNYIAIRLLTIHMIVEIANSDTECSPKEPLQLTQLQVLERMVSVPDVATTHDDSCSTTDSQAQLLLQVLKQGRRVSYAWDAKESPLSAALFLELGLPCSKLEQLLEQYPSIANEGDQSNRLKWLKLLPTRIVESTRETLAKLAEDVG